ncbi:MAG: glycoside hydrolase family 1 protein [Spirochaetes bacterium]|nr:glycoside hydrolase family 1 protein [Spirochaetota bacterium]
MYILIACAVIVLCIAGVSLYGNLRGIPPSGRMPLSGQEFPEGFLWATGEDAYQHEGGNLNNDWARWESQEPSPIKNGDRCGRAADFYNRYREDFDRSLGDRLMGHRIGVEWSRLEPSRGRYDEKAWRHYEAMLRAMRKRNFTVFLNLWHFTLPLWAADSGGWEDPRLMERWEALVARCAERFGPLVDYWSTMIDSQIYALAGYALGELPPNQRDLARALEVYRILIHAHGRAYRIIKERAGAEARVGMIYFFFHYQAKSFFLDRLVKRQTEDIFNWKFLDALHAGRIDVNVLLGPSVREESGLYRGTLDWLGVNYYTREVLSFDPFTPGFVKRTVCDKYPATDMGWEIYPEGLYRVCREAARRYPGVPLVIAENGLADERDDRRPRFILEHLAWTHRLINEGVPIFGYTYWSLTDNWEWAQGFAPKFGLYRIDRKTMKRTETASARLLRWIAGHNRLPREEELAGILDYRSRR